MSSQIKNILIIGAGGKLGPSILSAFTEDPHFTTSVLSRSSSTSIFPSDTKVIKISDDYPESQLLEAFKGQDAIISTIATASAKQQEAFIDTAIKAGAKRFVPSEFGSDTRNEKARTVLPKFLKGKYDTVQYLKGKESEGLTWTSFVTGPFFDLAMKLGYMGINVKDQKATLFNDGSTKWSTTTRDTIGLAVKNAMLIPEQTANKYIFIDSFTVSQREVVTAFEKATVKKWEVTNADVEVDKKEGREKMMKGDFSGAAQLIRYINLAGGHGGNFMEYEEGANELLSLPKESLYEVVARIL